MTDALPSGRESGLRPEELTPRRVVAELDRFIIGQDKAKRAVAVALRNRWRRLVVDDALRHEITPNNIILIGATGIGKTEIARRLARLAAAPFVKVEATRFTERGYVGGDVESMIRSLVDDAYDLVREELSQEVEEAAARGVEDRILDQLPPPLKPRPRPLTRRLRPPLQPPHPLHQPQHPLPILLKLIRTRPHLRLKYRHEISLIVSSYKFQVPR